MSATADSIQDIGTYRIISAPPPKGDIHKAIAAIMAEVGGVSKNRKNEQQGYKFRGIADIYLACQPLMARNGVHMSPHAVLDESVYERQTKSGSLQMHIRQRIEFRFYHTDGSWVSCVTTGEAMDTGDKASNKCMSAAVKYALIVTFAIPEEDPEADTESASPEAKAKPDKAPARTEPKPVAAKHTTRRADDVVPTREPGADEGDAAPAVNPMDLAAIMLSTKPKGLGWAKPHAVAWLKKYFGAEGPADLTNKQAFDAKILLLDRLESEVTYETRLEQFTAEGRVLSPDGVPF